jgi:hypothetical protein
MRVFAIFASLLTVFLGFIALYAQGDQIYLAFGLTATFGLVSIWMLRETFLIRFRFDDSYIYERSPWGRSRRIPWSAIRTYRYSKFMQCPVFETQDYGKLRLSIYMSGLDAFYAMLVSKNSGALNDTSPLSTEKS